MTHSSGYFSVLMGTCFVGVLTPAMCKARSVVANNCANDRQAAIPPSLIDLVVGNFADKNFAIYSTKIISNENHNCKGKEIILGANERHWGPGQ